MIMYRDILYRRYENMVLEYLRTIRKAEPTSEEVESEMSEICHIYSLLNTGKLRSRIYKIIRKLKKVHKKIINRSSSFTEIDLWRLIQDRPFIFREFDCICYQPSMEKMNACKIRRYYGDRPKVRKYDNKCCKSCLYTEAYIQKVYNELIKFKKTRTKSGFSIYFSMRGLGTTPN